MQFHPLLRSLDGNLFKYYLLKFIAMKMENESPNDLSNEDYRLFYRNKNNTIAMEDFIRQFVLCALFLIQ